MKFIRIMAIWAIVLAMLAYGPMAMAQEARERLLVTINGFPAVSGYAMVALFDSEAAYKSDEDRACYSQRIKLTRTQVRLVFEDLDSGWYAMAIFHDANSNNVLDKNKMGIPKESYAFSNNVRGLFGPPSFDKAKFQIKAPVQELVIDMAK